MTVLDILIRYRAALADGLMVTLKLAAATWLIGLTLGTFLGISAHRWPVLVGAPQRVLTFFASSVPFLIVLYWAHFPLQTLLGILIDPFVTATAVLSTLNVLAVSETWRSSLANFRREYALAAMVSGMTYRQTLQYIEMPLVFRHALPVLLIVQVAMLQMTLFASLISVDELFRVSQRINASVYRPIEIYTALGLFFVAICLPLYFVAFWLRRRCVRDLSER